MSKALVIVESPTKAKTIAKYLGSKYQVLSSFGHIRDLPKKRLGVKVEGGFEPEYEVPVDKAAKVKALKAAAKLSDDIYLASDEDREGEAIAWHVASVLKLKPSAIKRITFHEITKTAIEKALATPRALDQPLVDAQQARRVLDRLVGYELSPLLWKKVSRGLSAGRVQSVAVRLVVDRERERERFKVEEYWSIEAEFQTKTEKFSAKLFSIDGQKLDKLSLGAEAAASTLVTRTEQAEFTVQKITETTIHKAPPSPLTTSLLQQDASNRLGYSAKQTMQLAQRLYETGLISYMRTDSLNLNDEFLAATQKFIQSEFGVEFATGAKKYQTKKSGAQEAHEAIRPTDPASTPLSLQSTLEGNEWKLYNLIWRRTIASQLPPAQLSRQTVDLFGAALGYRAAGSKLLFPGFMKCWLAREDKLLPPLAEGDSLGRPTVVTPAQHFTEPAARYSDATLVKALEEHGIGRPSTYAPTISTIIDRGYVERDENKKFAPTALAGIVTDLLIEHFPDIVDYNFTAEIENDLDAVADGAKDWHEVIKSFYKPFHKLIKKKTVDLSRAEVMQETLIGIDPKSQERIIARTGRFGPYVQVGEATDENPKPPRASLEKNQLIQTLTLSDALKLLALPRTLGKLADESDLIVAKGPFGLYLKGGAGNVSLPEGIDPYTITIAEATPIFLDGIKEKAERLKPLKELGADPDTGAIITVRTGRYGNYVTDGVTNATINKKLDPLTISLAAAAELLKKKRSAPKRKWRKK